MDLRLNELKNWLQHHLKDFAPSVSTDSSLTIAPVSGDASFRRYFRVSIGGNNAPADNRSWIAMDAPPEKENSEPFVAVATFWRAKGLNVPEILLSDLPKGFLLLSDFGDSLLLNQLNDENADILYQRCMDDLLVIQSSFRKTSHPVTQPDTPQLFLPPYDHLLLRREMQLFTDWLVTKKLGYAMKPDETDLLDDTFQLLIHSALHQPQVPVHRDYHSRNIMLVEGDATLDDRDFQLGHLDFQDAVSGPISYDLVSLLRDCYIRWPKKRVDEWVSYYYRQATKSGLLDADPDQFTRWFDLMGIQRHLKASGIFARLSLRDGKHGYLNDIPLTLSYIESVSARYPELAEFRRWLSDVILPRLSQINSDTRNQKGRQKEHQKEPHSQ
ncbi:MAG: aminoglycoside phosphotransferase [Proteobacteria bacterium]|nr:MAG: aminoglycoside phosphotransferase [Pseudomonadota bacterium]PIE40304.1 MAG: aminoglycoside phosphotransferase [Gammaproteobacteria bacterium]